MTSPIRVCATCAYWRAGAQALTNKAAPDLSADDLGVCEAIPPHVTVVGGHAVTVQPLMHHSRRCADWSDVWIGYDPDDDPDGEPLPKPKPDPDVSKVRLLFPNPPRPIAA